MVVEDIMKGTEFKKMQPSKASMIIRKIKKVAPKSAKLYAKCPYSRFQPRLDFSP